MSDTTIGMADLYGQYLKIKEEVDALTAEVVRRAAFIDGPAVERFAGELSDFVGVRHTIPCGNGTDALILALMAVGISPGDEVIVPAFSYAATAEAVALLGGVVAMADVDARTFHLDPASVERLVTPRTKAVVPVHLFGSVCDMEPIMRIASERHLYVVEDNAQSLGAVYTFSDGTSKQAGGIGHIGCTSFFPTKNLGCFGDGGAVFTDDDALARKIRLLARHGQRGRYRHEIVGFNSRLDSIQAAVLSAKLPHLDEYIRTRRSIARRYRDALTDVEGIELPVETPFSTHTYHQYTLKVAHGRRDELKRKLEAAGVSSAIYYPLPLYRQPAYGGSCRCDASMRTAGHLSECVLSIPVHTELTTAQTERVIESIKHSLR